MHKIIRVLVSLVVMLAFAFCPASPVLAQTDAARAEARAPVQAALVSDVDALVAGGTVKIGLILKQDPGWHTYYKEPGDSGMKTSIEWQLPPGFKAGEIVWSKPEKFSEADMTTYGYKDQAFLGTVISIPADLKPEPQTFKANVKWLSCKDVCLPGKASLTITLPVAQSSAPTKDKALFDKLGDGFTGSVKDLSASDHQANAPVSVLDASYKNNNDSSNQNIWLILGSAFLGGLILNIMPCVLPVIAIKVMSFFEQAEEKPARVKLLGLTFSLGIILSFLSLALVVALVKSAGQAVGWGFQFQYPLFVLVMSAVVLVFALSLFGLFYVNISVGQNELNKLSSGDTLVGTFFKGVLATLLSTPCTAPFLGVALGFAFAQSNAIVALIFFVSGLGMASPYLLLTINPGWLKFLPKPGLWMDKFKQSMGFVLLATLVWLNNNMAVQVGPAVIGWLNYWLVGLAFSAWIIANYIDLTTETPRKIKIWSIAILFMLMSSWLCIFSQRDVMLALTPGAGFNYKSDTTGGEGLGFAPFTVDALNKELNANKTVLLDFTANWCLTCKVNEATVINNQAVKDTIKSLKVVTMKADWTNQDPDITKLLAKFGRSGVPLYVIYPAGKPSEPIVLPEVITVDMVVEKLKEAGPSQ